MRLVIKGQPRTKKTSQVIATNRKTGKPFVMSHKRTLGWTHDAQRQMQQQYRGNLIEGPVLVEYDIYRAADRGDLGGFEAAIDDAMQGIVYKNDSQIVSRHSIKLIDRENPRVEILVTAA